MNKYETLKHDMVVALKNGEKSRRVTLADIVATIDKAATAGKQRVEITDTLVNEVLIKYEKTVQEMIDTCPATRADLLDEYKIKLGSSYNYIDLLLFNYIYNAFVVVELKVTELKKEHVGQIEVYMNYVDRNVKSLNHNKTIGIIICKKDNRYVIEYCSDNRIISKEYKLV